MTKTVPLTAFVSLSTIFGSLTEAKDAPWKNSLEQQFKSAYRLARLEAKFVKGSTTFYRIQEKGTPLALQMNGLDFYEGDFGHLSNVISRGELLPAKGFKGLLGAVSANQRSLPKGEHVYLTRVEVKDDALVLHLVTRELFDVSVDNGVAQRHLFAVVKLDYGKEAMPGKAFEDLEADVGKIVATAGDAEARGKSEPAVDQRANDLWRAVDRGDAKAASRLLSSGVSPDLKDEKGFTILYLAAQDGKTEVARELIKAHASLDSRFEKDQATPLMAASSGGHPLIAQMLIEAGADVNAADSNGYTALHWAIQERHPEIALSLIQAHANSNAANEHGYTPLHMACMADSNLDVLKALLQAGATVNVRAAKSAQEATPLQFASQEGLTEVVRALLQAHADPSLKTPPMNNTALHVAASKGHAEVVKLLIGAGAPLGARNLMGKTPLLLATENGHQDVVDALKKAGAR